MPSFKLKEIYDSYFISGVPINNLTTLQLDDISTKFLDNSITLCGFVHDVKPTFIELMNDIHIYQDYICTSANSYSYGGRPIDLINFTFVADCSSILGKIQLKNYNKNDLLEIKGRLGIIPINLSKSSHFGPSLRLTLIADEIKKIEQNWLTREYFSLDKLVDPKSLDLKKELDNDGPVYLEDPPITIDFGHIIMGLLWLALIGFAIRIIVYPIIQFIMFIFRR